MTLDVVDAVGELVRLQSRRIHYLPGDESRFYTVRAPCLLAQLHSSLVNPTGGAGGRSVARSRVPISAQAMDLWIEVVSNVHGWADSLGLDRRRYRAEELAGWRYVERTPEWVRRLWPWLGPEAATGQSLPLPEPPPAVHRVRPEDDDPLADREIPPVGRLLRAAAAQAVALGREEVEDRIAYRATGWAERIRALVATAEERTYRMRGVTCEVCGARTVVDDRSGERLVVAAVEVRFTPMPGGDPDDLFPNWWCQACGATGWLPNVLLDTERDRT